MIMAQSIQAWMTAWQVAGSTVSWNVLLQFALCCECLVFVDAMAQQTTWTNRKPNFRPWIRLAHRCWRTRRTNVQWLWRQFRSGSSHPPREWRWGTIKSGATQSPSPSSCACACSKVTCKNDHDWRTGECHEKLSLEQKQKYVQTHLDGFTIPRYWSLKSCKNFLNKTRGNFFLKNSFCNYRPCFFPEWWGGQCACTAAKVPLSEEIQE